MRLLYLRFSGCGILLTLCACQPAKDPLASTQVALAGRVVDADRELGFAGAQVTAPDGKQVSTGKGGDFITQYTPSKKDLVSIAVQSSDTAPLSKPAPKGDAYVELSVKPWDAKQRFAADKGGSVMTTEGARIDISGSSLTKPGRGEMPGEVEAAVAFPNPNKPRHLSSISGNFEAQTSDGRRGKVSTESPLYVEVREGGDKLELSGKAQVQMPMRKPKAKAGSESWTLFRLDADAGVWMEAGLAEATTNEQGLPVFKAEIDRTGWWTVGSFYDDLTCVRGCVEDGAGAAIPVAQVSLSGVGFFSESVAYPDEMGCFAADVRTNSRLLVSIYSANGSVSQTADTGSAAARVQYDPMQCTSIGTFRVSTGVQPLLDASVDSPDDAGARADGGGQADAGVSEDAGAGEPDGGAVLDAGATECVVPTDMPAAACSFTLSRSVIAGPPNAGTVTLNGAVLTYDGLNGWNMSDSMHVVLLGAACSTWLGGGAELSVTFPCSALSP